MLLALTLIFVFVIYSAINFARAFTGRLHRDYLKHAWLKSTTWLALMIMTTAVVAYCANRFELTFLPFLYTLASLQLFIACCILIITIVNSRRARPLGLNLHTVGHDLPTISICIPARNETQDLEECLKSLIQSTYPKLEILVLDDCSQERRTPEIIRGFAHDGVIFVEGKEPPSDWLAKNYGYSQLADAANGEILLFCGVDARFEPETVANLVNLFNQGGYSMLSVVPKNILKSDASFGQSLIQPARYAWEFCLPRKYLGRPPVLSTCWLIYQQSLEDLGGFNAVSRKILPESYFAKASITNNKYAFVKSTHKIGLSSAKSIAEQRATAIRVRYPQLHHRPELVALVSLAELVQLFWPAIIFPIAIANGSILLGGISGLATLANLLTYGHMVNLAYQRFVPGGLLILPFAALYDVCLLNYSMWQYEFGEVIWKDRNISKPMTEVTTNLPKA